MPPISPFSQRNLYFGILGHSLKLFLGQICLCFGRRMVLAPTLNSNSFLFTASRTLCQHSLNIFDFLFYHQIETALSTDNFCFCDHQPFTAILICAHTTEWTAFSKGAAPSGKYCFPCIYFLKIAPFPSFDFPSHICYMAVTCISSALYFSSCHLTYTSWFWED